MSAKEKSLRLMTAEIRTEQDIVLVRRRARQLAAALGFQPQFQTGIATAVSEIARNAFQYARGARVDFSFSTESAARGKVQQFFVMEVRDSGPGIKDLDAILAGQRRSETGASSGIVAVRRIMDRVEFATSSSGTTVTLAKKLPESAAVWTPPKLQEIADQLPRQPATDLLEEIRIQNQELIAALEEANRRKEELEHVNQELAETNTGVLALYDELDTLHQIGLTLASKLELRPLIESIVGVTTTLTGADLGAFFFHEKKPEGWKLYATTGTRANVLEDLSPSTDANYFGEDFASGSLVHVLDIAADWEWRERTEFAKALAGRFPAGSCMIVPVVGSSPIILGALVFASDRANAFSERSERILTSVAIQATVGIEKARLFQSLRATSEAKDQFLAMLSHELRTPLNPIMGVISSLHGDPRVHPELREDLAMVLRNVRLEARLIDDLLDFNRLIKGKLPLVQEPLDMHAVIENVIKICREDLDAKRHQLEFIPGAGRAAVAGDAARLQQVLWNVLKNAIKFTPEQGRISIETSNAENRLRIVVTDNGCGIEPSALERIFIAFDQGQTRVGHFGGLGLGLSIARMFVELHGGTISAASEGVGRGARMTIDLPLTEASVQDHLPVAATAQAPEAKACRILLVDDHQDTLRMLQRLLTRRGFQVTAAASAAEAREKLPDKSFDLLISDLGLPDCSGLDFLREIRKTNDLPAIALSGYGMEADLANSRKAGFHAHLTKPVDFEELIRVIGSIIPRC